MPITPIMVNHLYQHFGEPAASALVEWLSEWERSLDTKLEQMEARLSASFRAEMKAAFSAFEAKVQTDMSRIEARLAWQLMGTVATLIGVVLALGGVFFRH
jgi:hypothetical protein